MPEIQISRSNVAGVLILATEWGTKDNIYCHFKHSQQITY